MNKLLRQEFNRQDLLRRNSKMPRNLDQIAGHTTRHG
jgi:hypothetical protein